MTMRVQEKFYSIQGEASRAGTPAVFVRLQGCSLTCPYCDSQQASRCTEPPKYVIHNEEEAIAFGIKVGTSPKDEVPCRLFVITGGEPLLKPNMKYLVPFCHTLLEKEYEVDFETTMVTSYDDIIKSNIGRNVTSVVEDFKKDLKTDPYYMNMHFVICPKLDKICYHPRTNMEDVMNFYTSVDDDYQIDTVLDYCEFKFVYYNEVHDNLLKFIDSWNDLCNNDFEMRDITSIMALTPIGDSYSREEYLESCEKTIDFCKKYGFKYSPRIHVDIWGLRTGV